jgi:hypothetical protein
MCTGEQRHYYKVVWVILADFDRLSVVVAVGMWATHTRQLASRMKSPACRVGNVTVFGAGQYSMRIWLDPNRMQARGLTTPDVIQALQQQSEQVTGQIGMPPAPPGQPFQLTVNVLGRLDDPDAFAAVIVKTGTSGDITRIRDIGRVELGAQTYGQIFTLDGKPPAGLAIFQSPGANAQAWLGRAATSPDSHFTRPRSGPGIAQANCAGHLPNRARGLRTTYRRSGPSMARDPGKPSGSPFQAQRDRAATAPRAPNPRARIFATPAALRSVSHNGRSAPTSRGRWWATKPPRHHATARARRRGHACLFTYGTDAVKQRHGFDPCPRRWTDPEGAVRPAGQRST